jgi:hypothetical protein
MSRLMPLPLPACLAGRIPVRLQQRRQLQRYGQALVCAGLLSAALLAWPMAVRAQTEVAVPVAPQATASAAPSASPVSMTPKAKAGPAAQADSIAPTGIKVERDADGVYITAITQWRPAPALLDALQRGVPMTFIMQAQVLQPRWYWWDKSLYTTTRIKRLAYQPLTRQWRISASTSDAGEAGNAAGTAAGIAAGTAALHQNVDDLDTALALISRAKHWRVASSAVLGDAQDLSVRFSFKLDLSALPRPFQIGINDNPDWDLNVDGTYPIPTLGAGTPAPKSPAQPQAPAAPTQTPTPGPTPTPTPEGAAQ